MHTIADLQIHSKYARAVSQQMDVPHIWQWGKRKGIGLLATGDWTHPLWMREIKTHLEEVGNGLLRLKQKKDTPQADGLRFLLATEVSCIYSQGGKARRIHTLIWVPSLAIAEKITHELLARGANLMADGRPILGLTSIQLAEMVFSVDSTCMIIPAHAWTPWFSLYGSESGFDSIEACFGPFAGDIFAIETGLSSDPAMNWRIPELDGRSIVSFSDAHSGVKLGREVTVFDLQELSYTTLCDAIKNGGGQQGIAPKNKIAFTVEFYPEEGKYHLTGHRACGVKQLPRETKTKGTLCPICGRKLTIGVLHRVEDLAQRSEAELRLRTGPVAGTRLQGIYSDLFPYRPPYVKLVPLLEIVSEVFGVATTSKKVQAEYSRLTDASAGELPLLLAASDEELTRIAGPTIAAAIDRVRRGDIMIDPGYDGVFGKVSIGTEGEKRGETGKKKDQMSLF